jgi:hypothetical protein
MEASSPAKRGESKAQEANPLEEQPLPGRACVRETHSVSNRGILLQSYCRGLTAIEYILGVRTLHTQTYAPHNCDHLVERSSRWHRNGAEDIAEPSCRGNRSSPCGVKKHQRLSLVSSSLFSLAAVFRCERGELLSAASADRLTGACGVPKI